MPIILLPAVLAMALIVSWLVAEWKGARTIRITLGVAMAAMIYASTLSMFRFSSNEDNRQVRNCLIFARKSIELGRANEVLTALQKFETKAAAGDGGARTGLCRELDGIANGANAPPK